MPLYYQQPVKPDSLEFKYAKEHTDPPKERTPTYFWLHALQNYNKLLKGLRQLFKATKTNTEHNIVQYFKRPAHLRPMNSS